MQEARGERGGEAAGDAVYPEVATLYFWYKFVNFRARKGRNGELK